MSGDHDHDERETRLTARAKALESLLVERGLVTPSAVDRVASIYENEVGPRGGARVVAKAWTDPAFKERLLADPVAACAELGVQGLAGSDMQVYENTDEVHNLVVCTLCSCYPWPVLGLPPTWYKDPGYRSRIVRDPRAALKEEFDLSIPDNVEIRVWDSSAETRFWVLPARPEGTESISEDVLAEMVTRDSMIGVAKVPAPAGAGS